jgi:hypothetical protein
MSAVRGIFFPRHGNDPGQIGGNAQMSDNETDKPPVSLEFIQRRLDSVNNNVNDMRRSVIAMQSRFDGMEARFGAMEARFGSMETRFASLETRMGAIESGQERMTVMLGRLVEASERK